VSKLRRIRTDGGDDGSADSGPAPLKDPDNGELPFESEESRG
jgi:hypothetical protein